MPELRLPYFELSPELLKGFREVKAAMLNSSLGAGLIEMIYLRVSQINGCSFCLNMHSQALVKLGEEPRRLHELAGWRCSSQFTERERSALAWAESLTEVARTHADDADYLPLRQHFSDKEISDLTFAVALMNAFNRLAVGMRQ